MANRHAARILCHSKIIQRSQNISPKIVLRNYSDESKKEEIAKVTHTGQVQLDVMCMHKILKTTILFWFLFSLLGIRAK